VRWLETSSLVLGQSDGSLVLADAHRSSVAVSPDFHGDAITGIEVCQENPRLLLSWSLDRSLKLFDLRESLGCRVIHRAVPDHRTHRSPDDYFSAAQFLSSDRCFVTAENNAQYPTLTSPLTLWDLRQLPPKKQPGRPSSPRSHCEKRGAFDAHSHLSAAVKRLELEVLRAGTDRDTLQSLAAQIDALDRSLLAARSSAPGVLSLHATVSSLVACHRSGQ